MAARMLLCLFTVYGPGAALPLGHAALMEAEAASFVQRSVSSEQRDVQAFQEKALNLEDAESLVTMAYEAAHDESQPTLEGKAISFLQRLAEHRSVAGTGASGALLRAAAEAERGGDSDAYEATESDASEVDLEAQGNSSLANPLDDFYLVDRWNSFDWVDITTDNEGKPGYCWHALGAKPLQCQLVPPPRMSLSDLPKAVNWKSAGYENACQAICARSKWCSGYGYQFVPNKKAITSGRNGKKYNVPGEEICTLFSSGRVSACTGRDARLQGIVPVYSARDLVLVDPQPKQRWLLDTVNDVPIRLKYLNRKPDDPYFCKAKYRDPPKDSMLFDKTVGFEVRSKHTKCQHVLSQEGMPVYLEEVEVHPMTLALVNSKTFSGLGEAKKVWENKCEKICSMFSWCSGYAYKALSKEKGIPEACGLYSKMERLVTSDKSWRGATKSEVKSKSKNTQMRPAHDVGRIATHFVPDIEEPGWICKAKTYATKYRTNAGAPVTCKSSKLGVVITAAMSIVGIFSTTTCDELTRSTTTTTTMAGDYSVNTTNMTTNMTMHGNYSVNTTNMTMDGNYSVNMTNMTMDGWRRTNMIVAGSASSNTSTRLPSPMDAMGSFDPVELMSLFTPESRRAAENFTRGQARDALAHFLEDTDEDARAIAALRARNTAADTCRVIFSGQVLRFLFYSLAGSVSNRYQCVVLHKEKYMCQANLLRVTGGLFGSLMYGYPRLVTECGSDPWPTSTLKCGGDFTKAVFFLAKAIWRMIQTTYLIDQDNDLDKWASRIDILASFTFIAEGILRALGPCLGELSGDDSKTILEKGDCYGTIAEVSALSVQTMSYGLSSMSNCWGWYKADAWK